MRVSSASHNSYTHMKLMISCLEMALESYTSCTSDTDEASYIQRYTQTHTHICTQLMINGLEMALDSKSCTSDTDEASWLAAARHSFSIHVPYASKKLKVTYKGQDTAGKKVRKLYVCMETVCMYGNCMYVCSKSSKMAHFVFKCNKEDYLSLYVEMQ